MSHSTFCGNCSQPKGPDEWSKPYCKDCTSASQQAEEFAIRENRDLAEARRLALLRRSQHTQANRPRSGVPAEMMGQFNILNLGTASKVPPGMIPVGNAVPLTDAGEKAL